MTPEQKRNVTVVFSGMLVGMAAAEVIPAHSLMMRLIIAAGFGWAASAAAIIAFRRRRKTGAAK